MLSAAGLPSREALGGQIVIVHADTDKVRRANWGPKLARALGWPWPPDDQGLLDHRAWDKLFPADRTEGPEPKVVVWGLSGAPRAARGSGEDRLRVEARYAHKRVRTRAKLTCPLILALPGRMHAGGPWPELEQYRRANQLVAPEPRCHYWLSERDLMFRELPDGAIHQKALRSLRERECARWLETDGEDVQAVLRAVHGFPWPYREDRGTLIDQELEGADRALRSALRADGAARRLFGTPERRHAFVSALREEASRLERPLSRLDVRFVLPIDEQMLDECPNGPALLHALEEEAHRVRADESKSGGDLEEERLVALAWRIVVLRALDDPSGSRHGKGSGDATSFEDPWTGIVCSVDGSAEDIRVLVIDDQVTPSEERGLEELAWRLRKTADRGVEMVRVTTWNTRDPDRPDQSCAWREVREEAYHAILLDLYFHGDADQGIDIYGHIRDTPGLKTSNQVPVLLYTTWPDGGLRIIEQMAATLEDPDLFSHVMPRSWLVDPHSFDEPAGWLVKRIESHESLEITLGIPPPKPDIQGNDRELLEALVASVQIGGTRLRSRPAAVLLLKLLASRRTAEVEGARLRVVDLPPRDAPAYSSLTNGKSRLQRVLSALPGPAKLETLDQREPAYVLSGPERVVVVFHWNDDRTGERRERREVLRPGESLNGLPSDLSRPGYYPKKSRR